MLKILRKCYKKLQEICKESRVKKIITLALIVNLSIVFLYVLAFAYTLSNYTTDFCQDYISARQFLEGNPMYAPHTCYANKALASYLQYNPHPPFSFLLYVPFALMSLRNASFAWTVVSCVGYLIATILLLKTLNWYSFQTLGLVFISSFLWPVFQSGLLNQNIIQLLLLLIVLGWFFERKGYEKLAGICIGIAGLLRFWPAVILAGMFIYGKRRAFYWGVGTLIAGVIFSILLFGTHVYIDYFGHVLRQEDLWVLNAYNVSLVKYIVRFLYAQNYSLEASVKVAEICAFMVFLLAFLFLRVSVKNEKYEDAVYGILLSLSLMLFPLVWDAALLVLLLPLTIVVLHIKTKSFVPKTWWFVFLCSLFFLWNPLALIIIRYNPQIPVLTHRITGLIFTIGALLFLFSQIWLFFMPQGAKIKKL